MTVAGVAPMIWRRLMCRYNSMGDDVFLLYIDDNHADRELFRRAMQQVPGFDVLAVDNGDQGIEDARVYAPDAIVLDLNMPRQDGEQVLEKLKRSRVTRNIPVIVMSAELDDARIRRILDKGAARYILKPLMLDELVEQIRDSVLQILQR